MEEGRKVEERLLLWKKLRADSKAKGADEASLEKEAEEEEEDDEKNEEEEEIEGEGLCVGEGMEERGAEECCWLDVCQLCTGTADLLGVPELTEEDDDESIPNELPTEEEEEFEGVDAFEVAPDVV